MYINSPGGSFTSMTAIYDTMQYVRPDIQTVCLGQAASAAAVLLAAGTPGKRLGAAELADPHPPAGHRGRLRSGARTWRSRPARSCGCARCWRRCWPGTADRTPEQVRKDIERDKILTAEEAKEYGLIDDDHPRAASSSALSRRCGRLAVTGAEVRRPGPGATVRRHVAHRSVVGARPGTSVGGSPSAERSTLGDAAGPRTRARRDDGERSARWHASVTAATC